ncbi:hypothetical protein GOBAR_AA23877 [Gossypium barbadense]|uniref:Uncharacterized protein n=1 Tax=Gossypium barbadense TaxID=3634 RepID=A0A2P5X0B0_GOSBA|nr:hypothetical protein GOBAR_AA23877 [Gossypium barbadense]
MDISGYRERNVGDMSVLGRQPPLSRWASAYIVEVDNRGCYICGRSNTLWTTCMIDPDTLQPRHCVGNVIVVVGDHRASRFETSWKNVYGRLCSIWIVGSPNSRGTYVRKKSKTFYAVLVKSKKHGDPADKSFTKLPEWSAGL